MKHVAPKQRRKSVVWTILGILAELMLTAAAVCALYIAWQMWWTGVQAEHNQIETRQSVSWSDPGQSDSVTIAQAQEGDPPTQPQSAQEGELIAQVYIPRFGSQWQRNLVEEPPSPNSTNTASATTKTRKCPAKSATSPSQATAMATDSHSATSTNCRKATRSSCARRITGTSTTTPATKSCCRPTSKWSPPTPKTPARRQPNAC